MEKLALLKADGNGGYGIEFLKDFEFDEHDIANMVSMVIYSFSKMLDKGVNEEQFITEVYTLVTQEFQTGKLEKTLNRLS